MVGKYVQVKEKCVDVVSASDLSAEHLAPGGDAGRLTVFTEKSIEAMGVSN